MVVFICFRIEAWFEIRGYVSVLPKIDRRRNVMSLVTAQLLFTHVVSQHTRKGLLCSIKKCPDRSYYGLTYSTRLMQRLYARCAEHKGT